MLPFDMIISILLPSKNMTNSSDYSVLSTSMRTRLKTL